MRIKELDGLRGIAVLAVISEHYLAWLPAVGSHYGWLGVDLFFVLSGFLITSILLDLRNRDHYFRVFYARRALRIFPPYFLGILVYLIVSLAAGEPGSWGLWLRYIFYYSSLLPTQPPEFTAVPAPILTGVLVGLSVLWSLSVEEIYYTIWAPIVRFTTHRSFALILAAMIVAAPILRWWMHAPNAPELYIFYCRMDGLAYGSAIALLVSERRRDPARWLAIDRLLDGAALVVLPAALIFWIVTLGDRANVWVTTVGLVLADLAFALVVHALIRRANGPQLWVRIFRARWLRSIGMVSYSLYLFHYPLRDIGLEIVYAFHLSRHVTLVIGMALGLGLSFGVAYALWYGMESRILRWKDRRVPNAKPEIQYPGAAAP